MKNIFFTLLTLLLVSACSKKTTDKSNQTTANTPVVVTPDKPIVSAKSPTEAKGIPKDVNPNILASLQRSPCFGYCPAFKYELYADGRVVYHGHSHTPRLGTHVAKADEAFMKNIADKALEIKYLSLSDHYPIENIAVSDVPTITTYIRIGNDGKLITNNYDPPKELTAFEQWLEAQFNTLNWQLAKE
jgi:hypothetical protein